MLHRILKSCFIVGVILIFSGIALALFTDISETMGINGILIISLITGLGVLLSVPSKIYIAIIYFQKKDKLVK